MQSVVMTSSECICFDKIASNANRSNIFSSELFLKQWLKQYYLLHLGAFCGKKGSRIYINFNLVFLNQVFYFRNDKNIEKDKLCVAGD